MHWDDYVDKWLAVNGYILVKRGFLDRDAEILKMNNCGEMKRGDIAKIFNLSTGRIAQIVKKDKHERTNSKD